MKKYFLKKAITTALLVLPFLHSSDAQNANTVKKNATVQYACLPCGSECDTAIYDKPGTCSHCNMSLIDRSTIVHKNIQPENLCQLKKEIVFLDVRTAAEFNGTADQKFGSIKGAINIPVQELEARMNELEKYKNKEIVVYCSHSRRSPRASYMLSQKGFKQVTNMQGGMSVWKEKVKDSDCNEKLYVAQ